MRATAAMMASTTRQLVKVILEGAGFRVSVAEDGEAGWTRLLAEPFDLVVSDIEMPRLDGLALLAKLRRHPRMRDIPMVLVTALSNEEDRRRAVDLGADAYVVKSAFDQEQLVAAVEEILG